MKALSIELHNLIEPCIQDMLHKIFKVIISRIIKTNSGTKNKQQLIKFRSSRPHTNIMLLKNTPSSMENSLSKITIIYQATGMQYFSVNIESLKPTSGLSRKHKLFLAVNFTVLIAEFCAILIRIYSENQKHKNIGVATGKIVQFTAYILLTLVSAISLLNSLFLRDKAKQIFRNCKKVSEILSVLNQSADYSAFENEFKTTMAKLFFGFIGSNSVLLIFTYQTSQKSFLKTLIAVYPYFFMTIVFGYWTLLVRLIGQNLRFVKESLAHLHKKHSMFRLNPEPYSHDLRIRRNQDTYNFIAKLKRIYGLIYDSTALVNELIGIPICLFLIFLVLSNISGGYRVFLSFKRDIPVGVIGGILKLKNKLL